MKIYFAASLRLLEIFKAMQEGNAEEWDLRVLRAKMFERKVLDLV